MPAWDYPYPAKSLAVKILRNLLAFMGLMQAYDPVEVASNH
jgi:hypothetical protein